MNEIVLSNNISWIDIEIKRFLTVPLKLKILRECCCFCLPICKLKMCSNYFITNFKNTDEEDFY